MNFQQLRFIRAAIQNSFNLTEVASHLNTSQSSVSKQIKELELELGIGIFVRRGKRLVGLTKAGEAVADIVAALLAEADSLKRLSAEIQNDNQGRLIVAATHNQARFTLPKIILRFTEMFPDVEVELRQGTPESVADALLAGEADVGFATEAVGDYPELQSYPCFSWRHVIAAPVGHPLLRAPVKSLADVAKYPIITYNPGFSGRVHIDNAFAQQGVEPDIRLTGTDTDVIKTYVRLGLGVGIFPEMAMVHEPSDGLAAVPGTSLFFAPSVAKIAILRGSLLRNYAYRLIEMAAPHLDFRALVNQRRNASFTSEAEILPFDQRLDLFAPF